MAKKSEEHRRLEKCIETILKKKDKLVAERLRMEIRNRIVEREMNKLSNELNGLIDQIVKTKPALTDEEFGVARNNKLRAALMLRQRCPDIPMDIAREMVDEALSEASTETAEN